MVSIMWNIIILEFHFQTFLPPQATLAINTLKTLPVLKPLTHEIDQIHHIRSIRKHNHPKFSEIL